MTKQTPLEILSKLHAASTQEWARDVLEWIEKQDAWCKRNHAERCSCPAGRGLRLDDQRRVLRDLGNFADLFPALKEQVERLKELSEIDYDRMHRVLWREKAERLSDLEIAQRQRAEKAEAALAQAQAEIERLKKEKGREE